MTMQGNTTERVRPILQAMERSIESARQRRVHGSTPPRQDAPPLRLHALPNPPTPVNPGTATTLKARPKKTA